MATSNLAGLFGTARTGYLNAEYWHPDGIGDTFFVSSSLGSSTGPGTTPEAAFATLDQAMDAAASNNNDVIIILPGHTETYTSTGTKMTADKAGVRVVGLGQGANRPTFTFSHTGATWVVSAAGVMLGNLLFVTGIDSVMTFATVSGDDFQLVDCETRDTTDIEVITDFTITGDRPIISGLFKNGYLSGNANVRVLSLNGVSGAIIEDCDFMTKVTTAVVGFVTTACDKVTIRRCNFLVSATTDLSKNVIDTITGSVWSVSGFDLGAGKPFTGGSGAAVSFSDIGTITNTGGTATIGAVLGDFATNTLYGILAGSAGIVTYPASAVPANGVSLAEVLRDLWDGVRNGTGGSEPGTDKSLIDAIGFDGVAAVASSAGMLRTASGTRFILPINVTSSTIPNNTQTSGDITGAASGNILVERITIETDSTGLAGPTNLEISTDNAIGLTGAGGPNVTTPIAALGANKTVNLHDAAGEVVPFVLESTKKIYVHGDDAACTGAGVVRITLHCVRMSDGASLAAGGIGS